MPDTKSHENAMNKGWEKKKVSEKCAIDDDVSICER